MIFRVYIWEGNSFQTEVQLSFSSNHSTQLMFDQQFLMQFQSVQSVLGFFFSLFLSLSLFFSSQILLQRLVEAFRLVLHHSLVKWKLLKILHNCIVFEYLFSLRPSWCVESMCLLTIRARQSLANENAN